MKVRYSDISNKRESQYAEMSIRLIFILAIFAIGFALISVLFGGHTSFHELMTVITENPVAPFDFAHVSATLSSWVDSLPSWLEWAGQGIRAIAMLFVSMAYNIGFVLRLLYYIFPS